MIARQVVRGGEPVAAAADDDDVVAILEARSAVRNMRGSGCGRPSKELAANFSRRWGIETRVA